MPRNHEFTIRFSKEEMDRVKSKAQDLGMTVSSFIRFIATQSKIKLEVSNE